MVIITRAVAVATVVGAVAVAGCGGDDRGDDVDDRGAQAAPTTSAPTTSDSAGGSVTGTSGGGSAIGSPPTSRPDVALEPVSGEWRDACETSGDMVDAAWQVDVGVQPDPQALAARIVALLGQIPPGRADDEIAYANDLIAAFAAGEDLTPYRPEFRVTVERLLRAVGEGCGVDADDPLPLPDRMVDDLERFLFGSATGG